MGIDSGTVPGLSTEKLIDRHIEVLSSDVPESNIDGAYGAHDGRATKVAPPVHILPMMLDAEGVLAHEVLLVLFHRLCRRLKIAPRPRLTQPRNTRVGVDADKEKPTGKYEFNIRDLHQSHPNTKHSSS